MATPPPPKSLKQKDAGKAIRRGYDRIKQAIKPSSHLSPQNSGSPAGASSASPALSTNTTAPAASQPVLSQNAGTIGQPTAPSTLGAKPANTAAASPGLTTTDKLGEAGDVALSGLETALRVLEKSSDAFPPLKSAVEGIIACLDIIPAAATNRKDYEELASELTATADTLNRYLGELGSEDPSGSAAHIGSSIEAEVAEIKKRQDRSKARQIIQSPQDQDEVIRRYRRIERLFRQMQSDIAFRILRNTNRQHVAALLQGMSPVDDARYNSSYSTTVRRRGCTAETREKVQADLQEWAKDPDAAKVYWMSGMAGTGKTTIAYSLCKWLEANQLLGASFFCSRVSSSCRDVNRIVSTIAYQLARYSPAFQSKLCKFLEGDPDASKLKVVQQFKKLVRDLLLESKDQIPEGVVIVIDALDECDDDYGVRLVLGTLLKFAATLPVKFFVTSRPEPTIRDRMLSLGDYSPAVLHLHDIEHSIVEGDIKKYLAEELSHMSPPPADEQIEQLAKRAGKLFIYAATVVRYILPTTGAANSIARLDAMLATDSQSATKGRPNKKYKELDELYSVILAAAFNSEVLEEEEQEAMRLVLRTAVCAKEPMTALAMASLLDLTELQVSVALRPLRSVLHVSESSGLISTLHASFPDYMLDHSRSGDFYCNLVQHSEHLAHRCFHVMKGQLRFNICGLRSSFIFDKDVPDLEQRIESCISPTLFYACRYWGEHLRLAGASDTFHNKLADFLNCRLLFWMEVLNLNLCAVKAITILIQVENWAQAAKIHSGVQKQVADARDFVTRFAAGACTRSTPHLYLSALPFCARSSSVYAHYWGRTQGLIDVRGAAINRRERAPQATWLTDPEINSVAYSPDGTRIVSGSQDRTIQVWDAYTGDIVTGPFEGHASSVGSVAFSQDGVYVVSGSEDGTVRVWDARTGDPVAGPFEGHTSSVSSVVFSPDGTHIVSGSYDRTIRVWDAHTGDLIGRPFQGHIDSVRSVAFSPDGTCVVSGSDDCTIRVWNVQTSSAVTRPFKGHKSSVRSVAFSPDGTQIISGSDDYTIRMWDARTGDFIAGPFRGHVSWVLSVGFSPDGTRIVSGSDDQSILVWDARTGVVVAGPFLGHTSWVTSVAFSPDGTHIVSGAHDGTIRVWNSRTDDNAADPFAGHVDSVRSVAFSPDGTHIVSGSEDWTIRLWDARTGDAIARPFEGHKGWVLSVAFSPDGTRIVSGSEDQTARVWDARTGNVVAGPFMGHHGWVMSVAFSPDGTHIVSSAFDQTIRVWDAHTSNVAPGRFEGCRGSVHSVAFSPDGTRIVSGSRDQTVRLWDARTGDAIARPFEGHTGWVLSVAFSPDGSRIVSGSDDQTARVWDAYTGNIVTEAFEGHTSWVMSVAFSPDSSRIVTGSHDRTIRVWDVRTGNVVAGPFEGHMNAVRSVAFSPDGTRIISGSDDYAIRVWDACADDIVSRLFSGHTSSAPLAASPSTPMVSDSSQQHGSLLNISTILIPKAIRQGQIHDTLIGAEGFKSNKDGWITANQAPLFWVPPDFCAHVPYPHNTLVIGTQGATLITYEQLLLGERWSECYTSR